MIPAPHLHLIINHIPLLGMLYGAFLLVVYFFRQNLGSVLLIALGLILISALFSVPTFYSGEWAEDIVENQSHVSVKPLSTSMKNQRKLLSGFWLQRAF
jgi:putative Mn2+ efflux pump MntP